MEVRARCTLVMAAVLPLSGCWQRPPASSAPFEVVRVSPDLGAPGEGPLLLNDAITVYFSAPVDPMYVIAERTFVVLDAAGHPVDGRLRAGETWVTFEPTPPVTSSYTDGSFRPASDYQLVVVGYPDAGIQALDGRRLARSYRRSFRTVALDALPADLPAPLRPIAGGTLPFVYRQWESTPGLPVDDPRIRLHFTSPVLPTSLAVAAFEVVLLQEAQLARGDRLPPRSIEPRGVRLLCLPGIEGYPGSTVELDLGTQVRVRATGEWVRLQPGDFVWIRFVTGAAALRDYSGRPLPPGSMQVGLVVPGGAATVVGWPTEEEWFAPPDDATPGFEVVAGGIVRPLVRQEAGDGSLGVFRPQRDVVLEPGVPFDRGDGTRVVSQGNVFPFRAVEIPSGVTVRLLASSGPVQLEALGRMWIAGGLVVVGEARAATVRSGDRADVATVFHGATASLCAAGGIRIDGSITSGATGAGVPLALVSGGTIELQGPIPLGSVLATEQGARRVTGYAERYLSVTVQMTPGLPPGAEALAVGLAPFRLLPADRSGGVVRLLQCDPQITIEWQAAPPDPVRSGMPERDVARMTPLRAVADGQRIDVASGSFLRIACTARVRGGEALPTLGGVRWVDKH